MTPTGINRRSLLTFGALGLAVGCKPSDTVSGSGKDPDKTKDKSAPRDRDFGARRPNINRMT